MQIQNDVTMNIINSDYLKKIEEKLIKYEGILVYCYADRIECLELVYYLE